MPAWARGQMVLVVRRVETLVDPLSQEQNFLKQRDRLGGRCLVMYCVCSTSKACVETMCSQVLIFMMET